MPKEKVQLAAIDFKANNPIKTWHVKTHKFTLGEEK